MKIVYALWGLLNLGFAVRSIVLDKGFWWIAMSVVSALCMFALAWWQGR